MPTDAPTILAASGGVIPGRRGGRAFDIGPLIRYAVDLSGVSGRAPRVCHVGTASGDQRWYAAELDDAFRAAGIVSTHLHLFPMPNHEDIEGHLLDMDVVWVSGGSVVNLLAVWRPHGLDAVFRRVWETGVVLGGSSAGSICWHRGGTTDSFGTALRPVTDGLGLLPWANGVHYDSEPERRPLLRRLVADGVLPRAYCTDDGAGLVYRGTELVEAVTQEPGARSHVLEPGPPGHAVEELLPTRLLRG